MSDRSSYARQAWLEKATIAVRGRISSEGRDVPETVRISCGFPKGSHGSGKAIGQCWASKASADAHNEIFISPELDDGVRILGVIAHELVHATVGVEAGHKRPFRDLSLAIGLEGKMTATTESEAFRAWANHILADIGQYPAGRLNVMLRKRQKNRQLKCLCEDCGYIARTTRSWVEKAGPPICPTDQVSMKCDPIDDDDEEGGDE